MHFFKISTWGRSSTEPERLATNEKAGGSSLRPTPIPDTPERSADGYTGLPWKQVFAGSNPAALTKIVRQAVSLSLRLNQLRKTKSRTRSPIGRGSCLRSKLMKVRILPRVPVPKRASPRGPRRRPAKPSIPGSNPGARSSNPGECGKDYIVSKTTERLYQFVAGLSGRMPMSTTWIERLRCEQEAAGSTPACPRWQ